MMSSDSQPRVMVFIDHSNLSRTLAREDLGGGRMMKAHYDQLLPLLRTWFSDEGWRLPVGDRAGDEPIRIYLGKTDKHRGKHQPPELVEDQRTGRVLNDEQDVVVRWGFWKDSKETCRALRREYNSGAWERCGQIKGESEEKETEVSLATDLVQYALRDKYDVAILISGDRDYVPAVRFVKTLVRVVSVESDGTSYVDVRRRKTTQEDRRRTKGEEKRILNLFFPTTSDDLKSVCGHFKSLQDVFPDLDWTRVPVPKRRAPRVFIVYGRDTELRDAIASHTRTLGLEPIFLEDQNPTAWTLLGHFLREAKSADFAVVAASADDIGRLLTDPSDSMRKRMRQNVVFELGFFVRHLGQGRVKVVSKMDEKEVELPSDWTGALYVPFDNNGEWKKKLEKALQTVGLVPRNRR